MFLNCLDNCPWICIIGLLSKQGSWFFFFLLNTEKHVILFTHTLLMWLMEVDRVK